MNTSFPSDRRNLRLLLVEDSAGDARLVQEELKQDGPEMFDIVWCDRLSAALERAKGELFDVALLDLGLPDSMGLETLKTLLASHSSFPIVIHTSVQEQETALAAIRMGAQDYVIKGKTDGRFLARALTYAVERRRLEKIKERFVQMLSHEIRTPLSVVLLSLANLTERLAKNPDGELSSILAIASRNIAMMERLIANSLELARLESGRAIINNRPFESKAVVEEAIQNLKRAADERRIAIRCSFPPNLPQGNSDPDLILQLLMNLLSNAIRFARSSIAVTARIVPKEKSVPAMIEISVTDDGHGINPADQGSLFQEFLQISRPEGGQGYKGTGLGLVICREIAARQGGKIGFKSEVGSGSTFYFTIPART